jgi:hypothetical protein
MTPPERRGAGNAPAVLLTLAALALFSAFVSLTTPASPHDVSNMARKVAFRPLAAVTGPARGPVHSGVNEEGPAQALVPGRAARVLGVVRGHDSDQHLLHVSR